MNGANRRRIQVEIEEYFKAAGWARRVVEKRSEHEAKIYTNRMKRRDDVRFLRIVVTEECGHVSRYTIKRRWPAVRPELLALQGV